MSPCVYNHDYKMCIYSTSTKSVINYKLGVGILEKICGCVSFAIVVEGGGADLGFPPHDPKYTHCMEQFLLPGALF